MFQFKSIYPIGIDISEQHLFALQLQKNLKGVAIRGQLHRELESLDNDGSDQEESLSSALREISKQNGCAGKRVALHLPLDKFLSFPVRFQVKNGNSIEEAIVQKAKEYLPFPLEQAIIDYPSIETLGLEESKRHIATVVALKKENLDQYLSIMKKSGFIVETVDFPVSSLMRLYQNLQGAIEKPIILFHMGDKQSLLASVNNECIIYQRTILWGIKPLLMRIQANFDMEGTWDKGKRLLFRYGLNYEEERPDRKVGDHGEDPASRDMHRALYQIITPSIEELIDEFLKIIGYLRSEERNAFPERICIFGQGALIRHLDTYIERRVNIPVELVNPLEKMARSNGHGRIDSLDETSFSLALGLAMRKVTWL